MKASLLKTVRHSNGESRKSRINYKILTFIVCIVISAFLWVMNMLSKKYTDTIEFHVQYQHVPQDKRLTPSTDLVSLKVTCTGFNIAEYKFGIKDAFVTVDAGQFRHKDNQYLYSLENKTHIEKIEDQLPDLKIVEATPDTLFLRLPQTNNN